MRQEIGVIVCGKKTESIVCGKNNESIVCGKKRDVKCVRQKMQQKQEMSVHCPSCQRAVQT